MCRKSLWEKAIKSGEAYYPPTFVTDGHFTHATAVPDRLIETANHFYQDDEGEWICLELNKTALKKVGIITRFEEGKPVGATDISGDWGGWICPHIYGGIPILDGIVTHTYPISRQDDGLFLQIVGLTDA